MIIEETKQKAREVFDMWFPIYSRGLDEDLREKLFEYFHCGYLAGTKHRGPQSGSTGSVNHSLAIDDANRNLDL